MGRLTRRAQILFPEDKYALLEKLAHRRKTSVATLVRDAVEEKYLKREAREQTDAIARIASMNLPVGSPEEMEEEIALGRLGIKKKR